MDISKYKLQFGKFIPRDIKGSTGKGDILLVNKQTKEETIIGVYTKSIETYNTNGSRIDNKRRTIYSLSWVRDGIKSIVGRDVNINNLSRSMNHEVAELQGFSGLYSRPTLISIKEQLLQLKK